MTTLYVHVACIWERGVLQYAANVGSKCISVAMDGAIDTNMYMYYIAQNLLKLRSGTIMLYLLYINFFKIMTTKIWSHTVVHADKIR